MDDKKMTTEQKIETLKNVRREFSNAVNKSKPYEDIRNQAQIAKMKAMSARKIAISNEKKAKEIKAKAFEKAEKARKLRVSGGVSYPSCKNSNIGYSIMEYMGVFYEGESKGGVGCVPNGYGVGKYKGGGVYAGEWQNSKKYGYGVQTFPNGGGHYGEFKDDLPNGFGVNIFPDGTRIEGEISDPVSFVVKTRPDGTRFEGSLNLRESSGIGIMNYPDGAYYIGEFKVRVPIQGRPEESMIVKNGKGVMTKANGNVQIGLWRDDGLINSLTE